MSKGSKGSFGRGVAKASTVAKNVVHHGNQCNPKHSAYQVSRTAGASSKPGK